ncbi:hypothetical protein UFOVP2_33 [uncultured Caudovirales phage]|uniref:Bacteriophage Mu, GpT n=1 Tax=uncultured Caudovirales phage TaxID=2100421 RepID=A0A6J5KFY4_9CAUD|nr:hypothetical protein UFOVP2_33 [uncultured Caudovirales phage]
MAGGIINTGSHPKALWPGVHAFWGQIFNEHPPEYPDLFDIEKSDQAYEEDVQITGFGLAQVKPEGSPMAYDSETQGPVTRYVHVAYALGYVVTYEELRDNLYETVSMRRAKANAFSMVQTLENIAAGFYNRAFNSSYTLADGQPALSTAHPFTTGGSGSNVLSPAADLSEAALEDICIQIMGFQTDRGLLVNFMPLSLHVPRQEWYNANRIMKSVLQSSTANNDINALKATNAFPKGIKLNHYLTAPHAWFVRTNAMNGLQFFWRDEPTFDMDNDFDTKNAKAATYMRFSLGMTDWRGLAGSNGP